MNPPRRTSPPADAPAPEERRVPTDPRISRRRLAVERLRRRRLFVRFCSVAAVGLLAAAALWSPLLKVHDVVLKGATETTRAEVLGAIRLSSGDNVLLLKTDEVAARVETLPWVRRATVDRKLPGTVIVEVSERRPAAVLAVGAARWLVDARGRVLQSGGRPGLPVVAGAQIAGLAPGSSVGSEAASGALKLLRVLPRKLKRRARAVFAPSYERLSLSLEGGPLVRFGAPEDLSAKAAVLEAVLERLRRSGETASYVDVRVPSKPAAG